MGLFSLRPSWNFPSNNYGQIFGIADSGVETFKGTPIKSLAREICQNSIDANLQNGNPTHIDFETFEITPDTIPGFEDLTNAFDLSLKFWSQQKSDKAKNFFKNAVKVSKQSKIVCLRISDHNTTGLTGSKEEYNSPWCNLTKSSGASDKSGTNGGSFGIGKFAPYACSAFRTVFYNTADKDGLFAYQGVSRLTSFKNKKGKPLKVLVSTVTIKIRRSLIRSLSIQIIAEHLVTMAQTSLLLDSQEKATGKKKW